MMHRKLGSKKKQCSCKICIAERVLIGDRVRDGKSKPGTCPIQGRFLQRDERRREAKGRQEGGPLLHISTAQCGAQSMRRRRGVAPPLCNSLSTSQLHPALSSSHCNNRQSKQMMSRDC